LKKIIVKIIFSALLLVMLMLESVNAASIVADKTEFNKGDIFTISINTEAKIKSSNFGLQYDSTKFKYVNISTSLKDPIVNFNESNVVWVSVADPIEENATNTISLTCEVIEDVKDDEKITFSITEYANNQNEELTSDRIEINSGVNEEGIVKSPFFIVLIVLIVLGAIVLLIRKLRSKNR